VTFVVAQDSNFLVKVSTVSHDRKMLYHWPTGVFNIVTCDSSKADEVTSIIKLFCWHWRWDKI